MGCSLPTSTGEFAGFLVAINSMSGSLGKKIAENIFDLNPERLHRLAMTFVFFVRTLQLPALNGRQHFILHTVATGCDSKISAYHCVVVGVLNMKSTDFFRFKPLKMQQKILLPKTPGTSGFWGPKYTSQVQRPPMILRVCKINHNKHTKLQWELRRSSICVFLSEQTPWFPFGTWMTNTMMTALPETSFGWKMNVLSGPGLFSETVLVSGRVVETKKTLSSRPNNCNSCMIQDLHDYICGPLGISFWLKDVNQKDFQEWDSRLREY